MRYQSETIAVILQRLNHNYFLPAIQREYVWHPDQIIQLFDSLMRNYPISSFLFWQLSEENYDKWDDDQLFSFDNFEKFIVAREELIRKRVKQMFG